MTETSYERARYSFNLALSLQQEAEMDLFRTIAEAQDTHGSVRATYRRLIKAEIRILRAARKNYNAAWRWWFAEQAAMELRRNVA